MDVLSKIDTESLFLRVGYMANGSMFEVKEYSDELLRLARLGAAAEKARPAEKIEQQLQAAEQQNAQLRADLAQREAECAKMREAIEPMLKVYNTPADKFKDYEDFLLQVTSHIKGIDEALSASSGKDILEHMRVMRELIEAARLVCNLSECDYSYQFMERVIKLREILAKVKGHKNEWGEW